jgi:hypothetical protein
MGIETRRDEDEIGAEGIERRQDDGRHGVAEFRAAITLAQGSIEDIAHSGFRRRPGAGIERHLMGRAIEQVAIGPEDVLRAIAVMDVEIDDRDALGIVALAGIESGNGGIVEEAKAHGPARFGMMAGRAHRAKDIMRFPTEDGVDARDRGTRGALGRLERARRHEGIHVDLGESVRRRGLADLGQIAVGMDAHDIFIARQRRLLALQRFEMGMREDLVDSLDAVHPLRVTRRVFML